MEISNSFSSISPQQPKTITESSSEQDTTTKEKVQEILPNSLAELKSKKGYELDFTEKAIIQAIEKANKALTGVTTNLKFSIHEKTKEIMVKVVNSETNEVIREIPPEKVLDMVAKMMEMSGLIIDEKR